MAKHRIKFISKSKYKNELLKIIEDIYNDDLILYDIKKLTGYSNYRRIRFGNIRIIFERTEKGNILIAMDNRGSIYKRI